MTFQLSRREGIVLSCKAFLGLWAGSSGLIGCGGAPINETLVSPGSAGEQELVVSWEEFLSKVQELSQIQFAPGWDQQSYVHDVAELMRVLDLSDPAVDAFWQNYSNQNPNFPEINNAHYETAFEVSILEFEPGETIKLHDHPEMTGVILCHSGDIDVVNYTLLDEVSTSGNHLLQRVREEKMRAGSVGTLTSTHGNIHELRANQFTRMIDVFTPPYDNVSTENSKWFNRDETPYNGSEGVFEATSY